MHATRGAILTSVALAATAAGTALVVGIAVLGRNSGDAVRPTPAPEFAVFDEASRAEILTYARTLSFSSLHGQSDTRRLSPACKACPVGPIASIEPEVGSALVPLKELKNGRIMARLINR